MATRRSPRGRERGAPTGRRASRRPLHQGQQRHRCSTCTPYRPEGWSPFCGWSSRTVDSGTARVYRRRPGRAHPGRTRYLAAGLQPHPAITACISPALLCRGATVSTWLFARRQVSDRTVGRGSDRRGSGPVRGRVAVLAEQQFRREGALTARSGRGAADTGDIAGRRGRLGRTTRPAMDRRRSGLCDGRMPGHRRCAAGARGSASAAACARLRPLRKARTVAAIRPGRRGRRLSHHLACGKGSTEAPTPALRPAERVGAGRPAATRAAPLALMRSVVVRG